MSHAILDVDILFTGGDILVDNHKKAALDAIAVKNGRIVAIGSTSEMEQLETKCRIPLEGRALAPGFIDAHNHFMLYCIAQRYMDCRPSANENIDAILERTSRKIKEVSPGGWVKGWGFADYRVKQRRFPSITELDDVAPSHPVAIIHASWHSAMVNSRGLEELGINEHTPDPIGGRIERDPTTGQPTGLLHEKALQGLTLDNLFMEFLTLSADEQMAAVRFGAAEYTKLGITSLCDPGVSPALLSVYQRAAKDGALSSRVVVMPNYEWSQPIIESGLVSGFGSQTLKLGAIKLFGDGSLSGRTAAVTQPYQGTHETGILYRDQETLNVIIQELENSGFQVAIHAIGDRAVKQALVAYEKVIFKNSGNARRHRIEHAGILNSNLIQCMANLDVVVATQPRMLFEQGDGFYRSCGEKRMKLVYPYRTLIEKGIHVAGSSDCPVVSHNPLLGMRDAVTRKTELGRTLASDQKLDPVQALRMFTCEAAYSLFEEDNRGTIEVGKLADLVVLSRNPLKTDPELWEDQIRVEMTIVDGKIVFSSGRQPCIQL